MRGDQNPTENLMNFLAEFEFFPPNHSVARAEAGIPCFPYERTGRNKVGFFSGFRFLTDVPDNVSDEIQNRVQRNADDQIAFNL